MWSLLLIWLFRLPHSFIFFWFYCVSLYIWFYILYTSVYFCKLCIIVVFMYYYYYYYYVCSDRGIPFHCAVLCIILYYDQHMHNYLTNYHTPTCFDTIVSSCSVYCFCVICTVLLPLGVNPTAVNKFIISYQCFWEWETFRTEKL